MIPAQHTKLKLYFTYSLLVVVIAATTGWFVAHSPRPYAGPYLTLVILLFAVAWFRLDLAVAFWILTFGVFTFEANLSAGVPNLYYHQLGLGVLVAVWFLKSTMTRDTGESQAYLWRSPLTKAILIWLFLCAVSVVPVVVGVRLGTGWRDQMYGMIVLLPLVAGYLLVAGTVTTRKQLKLVLFALVITGVIQTGFSTYLIIQTVGVSFKYGNLEVIQEYRDFLGNFLLANPSHAGALWLLFASMLVLGGAKVKTFSLLFYLVTWFRVLLGGSRAGIITMSLIPLIMVGIGRKFFLLVILLIALLAGVLLSLPWLQDYYALHAGLATASARFGLWKDGIRIALDHPLFGVGFFNYPAYSKPFNYLGRQYIGFSVHNMHLHIAVENGIPAAVAMLFVLTYAVRESWRLYTSSDDKLLRTLGLAVLVMAIWQFIDGSLVPAYAGYAAGLRRLRVLSGSAYLWIYFGLVVAARRIQQSQMKYSGIPDSFPKSGG